MIYSLISVLLNLGLTVDCPDKSSKTLHSGSSSLQEKKEKRFTWGGTPVLAYDSDLGLRYGAVLNLFDYGDRAIFPDYRQYARIRLYNSTGGTSNYSLLFDSESLIRRAHLTFEASYIEDAALDFYGFNGIQSRYSAEFTDPDAAGYVHKFFYHYHRKLFRSRLDFQVFLGSSEIRLYGGLAFSRYAILDIDGSNLNIPAGGGSGYYGSTLYRKYTEWDVIPEKEQAGGDLYTLSAGLIYDTRQSKINCKQGVWFESYMVYSMPVSHSSFFVKQITTLRHFIGISALDAVLTYRISSQQKMGGSIPFYGLSLFYASLENQDGPGGAHTLRGIKRNRFAADGFVLGNLEFRKNIVRFRFFKMAWEADISLFSDMVSITRRYHYPEENIPPDYRDLLTSGRKRAPHFTMGAGGYLIYNQNNVISVNYGYSPDPQLGDHGLYVGAGFMF